MSSSNFDFLKDTDPELHDIAALAEDLMHTHPAASLAQLRIFAEQCTKTYVYTQSVPDGWSNLGQSDRLNKLEARGLLSDSVLAAMHSIRKTGNLAIHSNEGTLREAKQQLENAHIVAVWLYSNVHGKSPSQANSEKEEKLKRLRERVKKLRRDKEKEASKVSRLREKSVVKDRRIASLKRAKQEVQEKEEGLRKKVKALRREKNARDQKIETLRQENAAKSSQIASLKENPRHKVSALRKKIRKLEQEKTAQDDRIALLKRDMEKMHQSARRKLAEAKSGDVKILSEHLSSLRSEKKQLRATIDDLQNRLSRMAEALEREKANGKRESEKQLRQYKKMFISRAQQLRQAKAEKKDLQDEVERLRALAETTARTPSSNGHPVAPDESEENMDAEHADIRKKLGEVFCTWCQQGTVILGRHYIFELTLQNVYRDAAVRPIYPASEDDSLFQFERSGRPAIFWFVDISDASFLLPVPRSDETFESLEPSFTAESQGRPADLIHVTPAYLATSDNEYHIDDTGQLRFETAS